ncbi:nitrous oxide reductase family maturation protein NosD [Calidifontibacillus oryziterrae]|uniref:nitrous oxide reductase family maturation protein NosD n=1 Tax=Calidifontibacillus oryziterrae TaxID=1191699 RepID=UPI0002FA75E2|nr:nitrous oxide reductase family maturation protein NosD [Calidifontibacillus oryziterrae]
MRIEKSTLFIQKYKNQQLIMAVCIAIVMFVIGAFLFITTKGFVFAEISLQEVVDLAEENDVIKLENKIYDGNLVITKPITIIGQSTTIIKGDGTGNVITIKSPNVRLENLTVTNGSFNRNTGEEFAGIKIMADHTIIKNITITDCFHGVYLSQSHYNEVSNIHVTGSKNGEIAGQGNGLHVYYSNYNKLLNNVIDGTRDGIFFDYSNHNVTIGNSIKHTRYGLHYMYSDHNEFYSNAFSYNLGGAAIMHSRGLVLRDNQFTLNQGTRSYGLLLQASNESVVAENKFFQNQRGIYIDQSQKNKIHNNEFVQNQIGIEVWASSSNLVFTENRFSNNIASVLTLGGKDKNSWSENGRGNYWGKAIPVLDLDQNGIGDYPVQYKSSLYQLVEENELAYLFLKSPAIKIYEKMNELLNKQEVMFRDEYPLIERN